jgi:hypothetical protein
MTLGTAVTNGCSSKISASLAGSVNALVVSANVFNTAFQKYHNHFWFEVIQVFGHVCSGPDLKVLPKGCFWVGLLCKALMVESSLGLQMRFYKC